MEALRQIAKVEDNILTLRLPESFRAMRVEVIILPADETIASTETEATVVRRRPSPKLKGTRITGDIMAPAVPEEDWDALK